MTDGYELWRCGHCGRCWTYHRTSRLNWRPPGGISESHMARVQLGNGVPDVTWCKSKGKEEIYMVTDDHELALFRLGGEDALVSGDELQ